MNNGIVIANFEKGNNTKGIFGVWQYSYGQVLRIQGLTLPPAVEVHFSLQNTGGEATPRIGVTKDGVTDVVIPDSLLENGDIAQNYEIYAFVYLRNETSGQTEYKITMHVTSRPKPEAFDRPEDAEIFKEAIKAVNESAARSAESEKQAEGWAHGREDLPERTQDNAKYYSDQAREDSAKTDADRKEVKRLVDSVSGIGEQVEKVEGLTKQAQISATNAALSEQAAKESENNAAQARAGAEVAEDNAELAAQRAEQDKAIVEQAKNLVKQMGQEVLDNKNLVDETAQGFDLKAQQALADVNNAGQAQTERVQTAGNDAVESVKAAQGTATRAVETAKSEAEQAVSDKGKEVLQSIPEDFQIQMGTKLDKNQGAEHAGKALVVGEDGNVTPSDKPAIPTKLPNPYKLTFDGAVTAEYDGSGAVTVTIPRSGATERIEKLASDITVELEPNKLYIFPEMENLTYTLKESEDKNIVNEYHFIFTSGASPVQVVHPLGVRIGNFTVLANKVYEVSIMENLLTSQNWEV